MSLLHIRHHKLKSRFQRKFLLVSFYYVAKTALLIATCLHISILYPILNQKSHLIAKAFNVSNVRSTTSLPWYVVVEFLWNALDKLLLCRSINSDMVIPQKIIESIYMTLDTNNLSSKFRLQILII